MACIGDAPLAIDADYRSNVISQNMPIAMLSYHAQSAIPFRKSRLGKQIRLLRGKAVRARKEVYQRCLFRPSGPEHVLLIFGSQRSGTTMLGYVFADDFRTAVLQEQSCITGDRTLRLRPCEEINRLLGRFRAPLVVAKPIVESHRAIELLAGVRDAKAIWMYRNFRDVVRSNVKRFHSQVEGLRSVVTGAPRSWRNEGVSEHTLALLKGFFAENMSRTDAAALGWYSRNVLFFEQVLDPRDDVLLCNYERLVKQPERVMREIYQFVGVDYPQRDITSQIDQQSVGGGETIEIDPHIESLCSKLLARLDEAFARQQSWTKTRAAQ